MTNTPTRKADLPDTLPLFPLDGALLLPAARLPLNFFEPRWLAMIDYAMAHGRMIGMVQPLSEIPTAEPRPPLYNVGCAGRIISFAETDDQRYLVTLLGVCRFEIGQDKALPQGFHTIQPEWKNFLNDLNITGQDEEIDRKRLVPVLRTYFRLHGVTADWDLVLNSNSHELVSSLAMLCPLPTNEKQALLESPTLKERAKLLISLLEMACLKQDEDEGARH